MKLDFCQLQKIEGQVLLCIALLKDIFYYPLQYIKFNSANTKIGIKRTRIPVACKNVYIGIHEWAGYSPSRIKKLKNGKIFQCGLLYQLQRFSMEKNVSKYHLTITVTISDSEKYNYDINWVKRNSDQVMLVSNIGQDFSGYSAFYNSIKDYPNSYIILTNSSVNNLMDPFLDKYLTYMENNPDVGLLRVSYSTKMFQTLIRRNFTPHIQSFFILTTISVLREIVMKNGGEFPGARIGNKHLLIRNGEIRLSQLALSLGYNLAVVRPDIGIPFKFVSKNEWSMPKGDIRLSVKDPNRITPISI